MDEAEAFDVWSVSHPPPALAHYNETYKCDKIEGNYR